MKKPKYKFPSQKVGIRHRILLILMILVGIAIFTKAAYIMFVEKDYWLTVAAKIEKDAKPIPAPRGNILSADGQMLAASLPEYRLYYDPFSYEKDSARREKDYAFRDSVLHAGMDSIVTEMKKIIPEIDTIRLRRLLTEGRKRGSRCLSLHHRRISYIQLQEIKQLPFFRLSNKRIGFNPEEFRRRKNPFGQLASRTLGRLRPENDSAQSGLELAFDSVLTGKPGVGHLGRVGNRWVDVVDTLPVPGCDVVTTLDVKVQDFVEKTLREQLSSIDAIAGMCILMEVKTGDVKAISSLSKTANGNYQELEPRAVTNMMEPGSVFKPMSFMVAMEDGKINMNTTFDTGNGVRMIHGSRMSDVSWRKGGDGVLSVPEIIKKSSNVGTSMLIYNAYHDDPDKFVEGIHRIGVTEDLKIPIPGYQTPKVKFRRDDPSKWYGTTLPWMSIGYETQIPPISTLTFYNGVANGGRLVAPRFVTSIRRGDEVVQEYPTVVLREQMCRPEVVRNIQICLEGVVGKNSGTGKAAYSREFPIAGKTGTAQIHEGGRRSDRYIVSFAGYFPADAPRYSMIVCIEKGGVAYGGAHCGPVFKSVAEMVMARSLKRDYSAAADSSENRTAVPPMLAGNIHALQTVLDNFKLPYQKSPLASTENAWGFNSAGMTGIVITPEEAQEGLPSVVGYGLRDAVFRLERLGVKVRTTGVGRVVRQSHDAGTPIKKGLVVKLELSTQPLSEKKKAKPAEAHHPDSTRKTQPAADQQTTTNSNQTADVHQASASKSAEKRTPQTTTTKAKV